MSEHFISPWYCVGCGIARSIADFGSPCECGSYALACDETHRFAPEELERFRSWVEQEVSAKDFPN